MELIDFLTETQERVRTEIHDRMQTPGSEYPYPEIVFTEIVMQHMAEVGMTGETQGCHFTAKVGNAHLRLSGFAISEDAEDLDLFVSLYGGVNEITAISDTDTKNAAEQCLRFLTQSANARLAKTMDESNDAYALALIIQDCYVNLEQIRVYVLTDKVAKSKNFQPREIKGKTVKLEVMDIERLHRHWSEGKPRDELVVNFEEVSGGPLPCVYVRGEVADYDYALTIFPGEALRFLYERFGPRLLEANVRSFLSANVKVNKGIRDTLRDDPEKFMAYNNGIVVVADQAELGKTADGGPGLLWLKGMQIVNGGQTTASIYFSKKKSPEVNLSHVRVPAKVIILRDSLDPAEEESLISDISKFANSQTQVKVSDLSANKPFHVALENLALRTYCPDGVSRWFYERAAGSYNVMLTREGTTPAKLRKLKTDIPASRKIIKTDLAKFLNAWNQKPDLVSQGSQKNFERFMDEINQLDPSMLPDVAAYKQLIAKAILFKKTQSILRPMFKAFQANVTTYTISLFASRVGSRMDFEKVWLQQDISHPLQAYLRILASHVNDILYESAAGRMISEWSKKAECWKAVRESKPPTIPDGLPEIR